MTVPRLIRRREVLAFIALNSTEAYAPESVLFRADEANGTAQPLVRLKVDSDLAVQHWAQIFGHGPRAALEPTPVTLAGKTWVNYFSSDTWRGYRTTVEADVPIVDDATPLDDTTREQLAALAEPVDERTCAYPGDQEHDHEACRDAVADTQGAS